MTLSIVIVNYNTFQLTSQCIASIEEKCIDLDYEIVLVDNASTECNPNDFLIKFPKIKLVVNPENSGFSKGNNLGIKEAKGTYILLLNSDTELINNAPKICLDFLISKENKGVITCQLIYPNGIIQHNTRRFRTIGWEIMEILPFYKFFSKKKSEEMMLHHYFDHQRFVEPDWIWGTFMLFKKDILELMPNNRLNDDFFMYCEDVLWCWEFKNLGHPSYYLPEAKVMHIHKGSSSEEKKIKVRKLGIKNHAIFMKKYYPNWKWYLWAVIYFPKQILGLMLFRLKLAKL